MKAIIEKQATYCCHTLLKDTDNGPFSVFVRRFTARRGPKTGKVRVQIERDVLHFEDVAALAAGVEGMGELPPEADEDWQYVPEEFRELS